MALDATVAGASANSYLTVAAADAFALSELGRNARDWLAATVEDKEAALTRATEEIDGAIGRVSAVYSATQALLFPRYSDGLLLPVRLTRATFLQAAFLIRNANVLDDAAGFRARGLSNFSNPDGTSGQLAEDPSFGRLHPRVERMLDEFAQGSVIGTIVTS